MRQLDRRSAMLALGAAILLYVTVFGALSLARYNTFHASTFDLGIITQVTWNTAHGRWFETSIDRATSAELIGSYLGNHVRPILVLLAPIYRLWPDPRLSLVLQSVALGIAAFPLYAVTRRQTDDAKAALVVACCYLAYPALGFLNLVDFHPVAFTIPLLYVAYWALLEKRMPLFWCAVLLVLSTKEEMVVPVGAWGLVNLLQRERRRVGLGLVAVAGLWAVLCFGLIIPCFNEGEPYRFLQLWSHLPGLSTGSPVQEGTARPISSASPEMTVLFLFHLALPLGFLPFFGPATLVVALPSLVYLLLAKSPAFHSVGYQYPAALIPWFFLAVVEGLRRARRVTRWPGGRRLYRLGLAFMLFGTIGTHVPLDPILLSSRAGMFRPDPCHEQVVEAMAMVPPDAGVATVNRFGAHLVNRRVMVALEFPPPFRLDHVQMADYVLLDLVDCRLVVAPNPRAGYADIVVQILESDHFRIRYWSDRILLLERGTPAEGEAEGVLGYVTGLVEQDRPCWP